MLATQPFLPERLAGSTCEHPPDDGRHHDDQQDDGNKPPKPHTFTASTAMVSTRVTASCEGCPCGDVVARETGDFTRLKNVRQARPHRDKLAHLGHGRHLEVAARSLRAEGTHQAGEGEVHSAASRSPSA